MRLVPRQPGPSKNGVANEHSSAVNNARSDSGSGVEGNCYLPDFSATNAVVALILISQLVAVALSIASDTASSSYFIELAKISVLMLWMVLTAAGVLTLARPVLAKESALVGTVFSLGLVLANVAVVSEAMYWAGHYFATTHFLTVTNVFPAERWEFLWRNLALSALVSAAVLRYFYVTHQWRSNMEKEAQSRITALQARIRPHFLFNSMNTIAALTRSDPEAAERAVEDLAELFRASLSNPGEPISLEQELDVARVYQRMEEQRLGPRLSVEWSMDGVSMQTRVPSLTIQPLLENAIYHGIEPLAEGGVITVFGEEDEGMVTITVINPVNTEGRTSSKGHRIALDNIRQRLELAYGDRARLEVEQLTDRFRVLVGFPLVA